MAEETIVIKKYENRRLYDATNSRYVNLEDVAKMLQRGNDVRVVDAGSGEDITRLILTQIIVEGAKAPDSSFPLDILRQMVVASGRASQESALRYMKAMLDIYQSTYRAMSPPINPFEFMQNPFASPSAGSGSAPAATRPAAPEAKAAAPADGSSQPEPEVDQLKQRVAELEKLVSTLAPAATRIRKSPRKRSLQGK